MTYELARSLLVSGAVSKESLGQALFAVVTQGMPLARALVTVGALGELRLEEELAKTGAPAVRYVRPLPDLMERLPRGLCMRLAAVPVRFDPHTDMVDVAVLDPGDPHPTAEIGYYLGMPVRAVRAPLEAIRDALELYPGGMRALAPPIHAPPPRDRLRVKETPIWGTPIPEDLLELVAAAERARQHPPSDVPIPLSRPRISHVGGHLRGGGPFSEAEPIFELRRSGIPVTERDASPLFPSIPSAPPTPAFPLLAPLSAKVPFSPNAPSPPFADASAFLSGIRSAEGRDAVLGLVLLGARAVARKAAILVVRKDALVGWACTAEFGDEATWKTVRLPLATPGLLATVLGGALYLGPLTGPIAAPLLAVTHHATNDVAIASIRVSGKSALVIVADELGDTLVSTQRIEELARVAGESLERILRQKKT